LTVTVVGKNADTANVFAGITTSYISPGYYDYVNAAALANGTYTYIFTATATTFNVDLVPGDTADAGVYADFDNVSLVELGDVVAAGGLFMRQVSDAGPMTASGGTEGEIVMNIGETPHAWYGCSVSDDAAATWVKLG
jgi:hypothetical protein